MSLHGPYEDGCRAVLARRPEYNTYSDFMLGWFPAFVAIFAQSVVTPDQLGHRELVLLSLLERRPEIARSSGAQVEALLTEEVISLLQAFAYVRASITHTVLFPEERDQIPLTGSTAVYPCPDLSAQRSRDGPNA